MKGVQFVPPKLLDLYKENVVMELQSQIAAKNLFGIGEVHGVKDNVDLYVTIFEKFNFEAIALEYPVDCAGDLTSFLETGQYPTHWFFQEINDGRFSLEMLSALKRLYNKGLLKKIICYDRRKNTTTWNQRDEDYASAFMEQYEPTLRTLIVGGGYHIKTEPFKSEFEKGELYPMCYHLQLELGNFPTACCVYTNGDFYNFGLQSFVQCDYPKDGGNVMRVKKYSYNFILRDVKPIISQLN